MLDEGGGVVGGEAKKINTARNQQEGRKRKTNHTQKMIIVRSLMGSSFDYNFSFTWLGVEGWQMNRKNKISLLLSNAHGGFDTKLSL